MPEWFADDRFWQDLFPFEFGDDAFAAAEGQVERALALTGIERGDALDVGCGPGRHCVPLAKRGFRVTALDLSRFHLGKARERAAAAGVAIDFVESDMRTFVQPERFDLAHIARSLKPGGTLLIDVLSKEYLARVFQPTLSWRLPDGAMRIMRQEVVDDWTRTRNEWLFVRDGQMRTYHFDLRVYSGQELKTLLTAAGLDEVRLFGGFDGRPYARDAERLIAVARKA